MKNTTNKKGFTLVELIIVVTILAILATIAFISFQSYTAQSRDAKIQSELGNIRNVIEVEMSKGVSVLNFATSTGSNLASLSLGGTGVTISDSTKYKAGDINKELLGTTTTNTYKIGASTSLGGVYQLAGKLTTDGNKSYVIGNYSKRTTTGSGVGYLKVGDYVTGTGITGTGAITAVSTDKTTVTVATGSVSTGSIAVANVRLAANESDGLIGSDANYAGSGTAVTDGSTTALPF